MEPTKRKVGLVTLGFSLIFIGGTYLLNQYTKYSLLKDLYLLWPIFLIMLGLEFIITKFVYDRKGREVQLSPSILSIFLIVAILGITAIWQHIPELKNIPFYMNNADYYRYTVTQSYDSGPISPDNLESIAVNNTMGHIDIKPSSDGRLFVKAQIKVRSNNEERAREYIHSAIDIRQGTNTLIETKRMYDESRIIGSVSVDYTILVPGDINLKVENNFGDITVTGIQGDVSTYNQNGLSRITDIEGNVDVESSFGRVTLEGISGKVEATNKNGEINATNIGIRAELETSFGNIRAGNVQGDLAANTKSGDIEVENIRGNADLTDSFGHISSANVQGNVTAANKNGDIDVDEAAGSITAETSFGSIMWVTSNLDDTDLDARTRFGSIDGTAFNLPAEKDTTTTKIVKTFGTGSRKVRLKTSNGSITIKK